MPYVLPQVLVFQDFQIVPAIVANPLNAHIVGPNGSLIRYSETTERASGELGYYDNVMDTDYAYPTKPTGATVDQDYFKLWINNGLLQYFEDTVASDSEILTVSGKKNQVFSDTVKFATNGDDAHDVLFLDRGVRVGDIAKIRIVPAIGDPETLWTYVKGFVGDVAAATFNSTMTADASNQAVIAASSNTVLQTAGVDNCVELTADETGYDGLPDGGVTETYTIIVTGSSTGGDYTTATIRIVSESGNDDQTSVIPAGTSITPAPTAVGTRGLEVTFTFTNLGPCTTRSAIAGVTNNDLIVGQIWTVAVEQQYAVVPTVAVDGSYAGTQDTTYIVEVLRGGTLLSSSIDMSVPVLLSISTNNGYDSATLEIHLEDIEYALGNFGLTIAFSENELIQGDRWSLVVTSGTNGPYKTLILGHNWQGDYVEEPADVTLFILKPDLQIGQNKTEAPPNLNYEIDANEITVNAGMTAFDSTWTDEGVPVALPILSEASQEYGLLHAEYRLWLPDKCSLVFTIDDVGDLDDIPGPLDPDNPLKWGVFKALSNSNGVPVRYTAICDETDLDEWAQALGMLLERSDVYGLVPLTRTRAVLDLFAAHVDAQSEAEQGLWRVTWFSLSGIPEIPVVSAGSTIPGHLAATTTDGELALATVEDNPDVTGTQYTRLIVPAGNAQFETNGTRVKDIVRINYANDAFGNPTYNEFQIDEVVNEDELILATGLGAPINVPVRIEVWRSLNSTEEAAEIASDAGSWANRRVRAVWPDTIESSGTIQEGYHVCAALAGLASGILPHQGMTNLAIAGFSDVSRTTNKFTRTNLDTMASSGTWIVTQARDGEIYTRHAVTTGDTNDLNQREEMVTRNVDSMSYRFRSQYEPFIGVSNVTPSLLALLGLETRSLVNILSSESISTRLGGQLIDATVVEVRQHTLFRDRAVITLNLIVPYPLNNVEVNLVI